MDKLYDILIIGGGPAGLTAALFGARAGKSVAVLEKGFVGGQTSSVPNIENYPAFNSISGYELTDKMLQHALEYGAEMIYDDVVKLSLAEDVKIVYTANEVYKSKAVILAMGAASKKLGLKREDELVGSGVSYCASCDGNFFKHKVVAVYGSGAHAKNDTKYLSALASKVYFISPSKIVDKTEYAPNVQFVEDKIISELEGTPLSSVVIRDGQGERTELQVEGLFVAAGYTPNTFLVKGIVELNERGYIITDENMRTKLKGVFAAGDIRAKTLRQIVTAAADGAIAANQAAKI